MADLQLAVEGNTGKRIPGLSNSDIELTYDAIDVLYERRFGILSKPEVPALNFFAVFK